LLQVPTLALISSGRGSGKTKVAEALIRGLTNSGLKVAAAKHISGSRFTIDASGTDTRRLAEAGAQEVVAVTPAEIVNILKADTSELSLEALVKLFKPADLIVLEGFKNLVLQREDVATIIVSSGAAEALNLVKTARRPVAVITGEADSEEPKLRETGTPLLHFPQEATRLVELALEHYRAQRALGETLAALGNLDCGDCGYETCYQHAQAIQAGRSSLEKCTVLKADQKAKVTIDGTSLPLKGFVQDIIRKTVLGMISSLHKTDIRGDELLDITIKRPKTPPQQAEESPSNR